MNNQRSADLNSKLKAGTEVIFNGKSAYVEHDRQDGFINLRPTKEKNHKADDTFLISKSEIKVSHKVNKPIKNKPKYAYTPVKKKPLSDARKLEPKQLNTFFKSIENDIALNCQNCGKTLFTPTPRAKRSVCCHILPKAKFKNIATNSNNIVYMGAGYCGSCNCHDYFDETVDHRVKMRIYTRVLRQYELLKPLLSSKQIVRANDYLGITKKSNNLLKDLKEANA